jgi:hypothetical protein
MPTSAFITRAFGIVASGAILTGCGSATTPAVGDQLTLVSSVPSWMLARVRPAFHGKIGPDAGSNDLYVAQFYGSDILGYESNRHGSADKKNGPPACEITGVFGVNDIGADGSGNVIDPDGTHYIKIYAPNCGSELGEISDYYGEPDDAYSANAGTGTIVVTNIEDTEQKYGSVLVCTLKKGCSRHLTNANMAGLVAGVAVDKTGDCWASSTNSSGAASLTYFKGCRGSGQTATGYENQSYGGLEVDKEGNLISIDVNNAAIYVYAGCNPACTLVGGPFALHGESIYGKLDPAGKTFAAPEFDSGQVDIYAYSPSRGLTYEYSFSNGLSASLLPEGTAYAPALIQH